MIYFKLTEEDNEVLMAMPTIEETKESVFSIDPTSAPGPDGLNVQFFRIVGQ